MAVASTPSGTTVRAERTLHELDDLDVVIVPALDTFTGPATLAALDDQKTRRTVLALRSLQLDRSLIAAACTGVFALAETGLLDERRVTTTRRVSAELAQHVARLLLIDDRPSQAGYVAVDHPEHHDPIVVAFEQHVRRHLDQSFDIASLGLTPLDIVQRLRLERAGHLRRTTELSTESIANRVGYSNAETLRALQRRTNRPRNPSPAAQAFGG
jgi:transcriptional regulator GlxA family with amidase domain